MRTKKWLSAVLAGALLFGCMAYTKIHIRHLEARVDRMALSLDQRDHKIQGVNYAFEESFAKYFGEHGIAEVERAAKQLAEQKPQRKQGEHL